MIKSAVALLQSPSLATSGANIAVAEHGVSHAEICMCAALLRIGNASVCNESKFRGVVSKRKCPSASGVSSISVDCICQGRSRGQRPVSKI